MRPLYFAENETLLAGLVSAGDGQVLRLGRRGISPDLERTKQPAVSRKNSTITQSYHGGNMKKILKQLLICMLLITLIVPLLPVSTASSPLTQNEMRLITGGKVAVDCGVAASFAQFLCLLTGAGTTACSVAYGIVYVGCVVAQII